MNKPTFKFTVISVLVVMLFSGCSGIAMLSPKQSQNLLPAPSQQGSVNQDIQPTTTPSDIVAGTDTNNLLLAYENTLTQIYDQVSPSVVNIRVVQEVSNTTSSDGTVPSIPFFGLPGLPSQPQPNTPQYSQALGSGFVWDQQGDIVTNNHVVDGADKIEVTFSDGSVAQAELVGTDPDSDLAVIHVSVPSERLKPVVMGDSNQARVGQLAIAIGNPFGLQGSMTVGIVSALGRTLPADQTTIDGTSYSIPDIIQTDAPINPGNSGGVLVNDNGELIGVTAAIESPVQANAGIGFAIPAAIVRRVVPALIKTGSYEHPYLGLSGIRLSPEIAQAMDLPADQRGALVEEVVSGGPADNAGIRGSDQQFSLDGIDILVGGDVIVAIDGQQVNTMDDLIAYLNDSTEIGQRVSLTILRDGKTQQIEVALKARPGNNSSITEVSQGSGQIWLGIQGISMDENLADAMGLDTSTQGVLVEQVQVDSPADNAGLRGSFKPVQVQGQTVLVGGDVIISMDDTPIHNVNELARYLQSATANQKVTISIIRGKKEMHLSVELLEVPTP